MKLKMIKAPRPSQTEMLLHTGFGDYEVSVGDTIEVSDAAAEQILAQWPGCFQAETQAVPVEKMAKGYKNKAVAADKEESKGE